MNGWIGIGLAAAAAATPGCFGPALPAIDCGDGNLCPSGLVCRLSDRVCIDPVADAGAIDPDGPVADPDAGDGGVELMLIDRGLLVRYFIDEAASGDEPGTLGDDSSPATSLQLAYGNNMAFTTRGGNRGLDWTQAGGAGAAARPITGELEMIDGTSELTYEVVAEIDALAPDQPGFLIHVGTVDEDATVVRTDAGVEVIYSGGGQLTGWAAPLVSGEREVIHVVFDSGLAVAANRLRLYIDGSLVATSTGDRPLPGGSVDLGNDAALVVGNDLAGDRSIDGSIHYAAIYLGALTASEVATNAGQLQLRDDP